MIVDLLRYNPTYTFDPKKPTDLEKYRALRKLASAVYVRRGLSDKRIAETPKLDLWLPVGRLIHEMGFDDWQWFDQDVPIRDDGRFKKVTPCGMQAWRGDMVVRVFAGTQDAQDARSDLDIAPHAVPWGGGISDGVEDYRTAFSWRRNLREFKSVYIVGHSLGGMTAEAEFRHLQHSGINPECWTWGQAAIHDLQSAKACRLSNAGYHRFVAGRDLVARMGWEPDYTPITPLGKKWLCHSGPAIRIDYQGRFNPLSGLDRWRLWRGVADHSIDGVYAQV